MCDDGSGTRHGDMMGHERCATGCVVEYGDGKPVGIRRWRPPRRVQGDGHADSVGVAETPYFGPRRC